MLEIIGMGKDELLGLSPDSLTRPDSVGRLLTEEEVVYMATVLGAFWQYDYEAAKEGRVGMHALLKSGLHSDGFFYSRILLERSNIRRIFANQLVLRLKRLKSFSRPDWVAGIPDGATELGKDVAEILGVKNAEMKKVDGKIVLESSIAPYETLLGIEDFCTRGTGFKEAIVDVLSRQPNVGLLRFEGVILNRGGLKEIKIEGFSPFRIVAIAEHRINDWEPEVCPLCKIGSEPIKAKATDENWRLITTSQKIT